MTPTASLLLPAPPFVSVSDERRLQFFPRGRRRARLCSSGVEWGSVRAGMVSSLVGSRRTRRRSVICASLFGVGAPEALVIGVVALLVFGPKGLAEVARNLGKTLRAFQPTIRELQDVSREFKSTLEREIGIDEVPPSTNYKPTTMNNNQQPAADPTPDVKPEPAPYTSEELMKVTEEQIAASAAAAWNTQQPATSQQQEAASLTQSTTEATSARNDGPAASAPSPASAAATESDPSQVNEPEKAETER